MTAKNKVNAKAITSDQLEKMFDNDEEAADMAISRNAVVNTWIADRLRTMRRREVVHA